jgi:hypothetical protein
VRFRKYSLSIWFQIPLPQIPPQVVALLPTNGTDDAAKIVEQHLKLSKLGGGRNWLDPGF